MKNARAKFAKILFFIVKYAKFGFLLPSSSWLLKLLKYENVTSSFGRLCQNIAPRSVPHVQHDYFLHWTNQIIDSWPCRWRCRRQILKSLFSQILPYRSQQKIWQFIAEFGHFDTKSCRYKSTRHKLKSFRAIIKLDSIHIESRFDSTQPLRSQPFSGPIGAKIAIPVNQWGCFQAPTVMKTLSIRVSFEVLGKNCKNHLHQNELKAMLALANRIISSWKS